MSVAYVTGMPLCVRASASGGFHILDADGEDVEGVDRVHLDCNPAGLKARVFVRHSLWEEANVIEVDLVAKPTPAITEAR